MSKYLALGLYIDGEWLNGDGRDAQAVLNPATGETLGDVPVASIADLDRALQTAQRGFDSWRITPAEQRFAIMIKAAALLRERADQIAQIVTMEEGKPLAEAKGEALAGAAMLEFHAGETMRIFGRVMQRPSGMRSMMLPQPVGPVAAFCAWNFPAMNVIRKVAPAIAAGCSIILKPSEETPGSAVAVMRCFQDAGLPGNVAQIVFGVPDQISRHLLGSPITRKLSFTGSVPVGKQLMKLAADTVMKMTMELGGHSPVLVFDDCDLEKTLDILVTHKFRNAGQVCIAPTRFHIQEGVYEKFAAGFADRTRALKLGSGLDTSTHMGPLANPRRPEAIASMIADAAKAGARLLAGGVPREGNGFFFEPTVIADVSLEASAMNEEPFGPLALLRPFRTIDDAITEANRLPFGLAAYCFTEQGRRQNRLAEELEAGLIAINNVRLTWPDSPFGGIKESGFGSEDGPEGVQNHLITKTVHIA